MVLRLLIFHEFFAFFCACLFYQNNLIGYLDICENPKLKFGIRETMW